MIFFEKSNAVLSEAKTLLENVGDNDSCDEVIDCLQKLPEFPKRYRLEPNLFEVDIDYLSLMRVHLEGLFTFASVALGDCAPEGLFEISDIADQSHSFYNKRVCVNFDKTKILVYKEENALLENDEYDPEDFVDELSCYKPELYLGSFCHRDGVCTLDYCSSHSSDAKAIQVLSAAIVCCRVNSFLDSRNALIKCDFDFNDGFQKRCRRTHPLEMVRGQIAELIMGHRLALCEVCRRPYVIDNGSGRKNSRKKCAIVLA